MNFYLRCLSAFTATIMKQKEYSNPLHWAAFTLIGEAD
jgi:CHAT domain-containing protein